MRKIDLDYEALNPLLANYSRWHARVLWKVSSNLAFYQKVHGRKPRSPDLITFFKNILRFGAVKDVIVKMDPNTQQSRGFGFVLFMNEASIDAVVNGGPHNLDGKRVSVIIEFF